MKVTLAGSPTVTYLYDATGTIYLTVNAGLRNDTANLYDGTAATDHFWAKLGAAVLTDGDPDLNTGDLVTPSTYYYKVYGFDSNVNDRVNVDGLAGGTNKKHVVNPYDYVLTMTGIWSDE
jgi:hypothetical protein